MQPTEQPADRRYQFHRLSKHVNALQLEAIPNTGPIYSMPCYSLDLALTRDELQLAIDTGDFENLMAADFEAYQMKYEVLRETRTARRGPK